MQHKMDNYSVIGKRFPRIDALSKVTGTAIFSGDVLFPNMLHGKILRSPYPHARIRRIDISKAKAMPGVAAVITAEDVPGYKKKNPLLLAEMVHMALDKVIYESQPVAVVAAETQEIAEQALGLIDVEYEELTPVLDVMEAMVPETPLLYPDLYTNLITQVPANSESKPSNIAYHINMNKGDIKKGFEQADVILENTFSTQPVHHGYIEPFAAVASIDVSGKVTIWTQSQGTFHARQMIAEFLGVAVTRVKIMPVEIGGAFGGKSFLPLAPLCGLLAMKTGRPVRMEMSREEVLKDSRPAPGSVSSVKIGATKEGKITAVSARFIYDAGGFPEMSHSMFVRFNAFCLYKIDNLNIEAFDVLTNKVPVTFYRAPGDPQLHFAIESQMDMLAKKLGIDPFDIRMLNLAEEGEKMPSGEALPRIGTRETLQSMKEHLKRKNKLEGKNQGRGIALSFWHGSAGTYGAIVNVNPDGTVTLITGVTDISGSRTSIAQIVAEEFGIPMSSVNVVVGDTDIAPWSSPSVGSLTVYSLSHAAQRACQDAIDQIKRLAAPRLEAKYSSLEYIDGRVQVKGNAQKNLSLRALAQTILGMRGEGPIAGWGSIGGLPSAPGVAVHAADVEVDKETGKVKILAYSISQDVGRAINPLSVEGQMQGAVVQGIGWSLMEGYIFKDGIVQNSSLLDYRLPTAADVPNIDTLIIEVNSNSGIYGLRQVGESPMVPALAAIANAIYNATGMRIRNAPMTPEVLFRKMREPPGDLASR